MSISFLPFVIINSITELTPEQLKKWKIQLLMLDFDNTIVPYTTSEPTEKVRSWLKMMLQTDIKICVVSNSKKPRVSVFCEKYGLECITHAAKPSQKGIMACMDKFAVGAENAALVGDQIFTDTLGGNCAGVKTILVEAINNHNIWLKLRHVAEMPFICAAKNRRINHE